MFQHVHQTEASLGKKLRSLDGLEEYFWLTENTFPRTTMILAEVQGATTVEAWRTHFVKCSSDIRSSPRGFAKSPGERPYFEALPDIQLPLLVMPLDGANLDASIAEEPVLRNRVVREWAGNDVKTPSQPDPPHATPKFSAIRGTDDGQRSGEGSGMTAAIGGFDTGRLKSPDHGHTEASEENVPAFRKK